MPESLFCALVSVRVETGARTTYNVRFASQDSCDEWWRTLQDQKNINRVAKGWGIKRRSPQSYIIGHEALKYIWTQLFDLSSIENCLIIEMRGTPTETYPILPPPSRADHLNRKAYYIRSRALPNYFWCANKQLVGKAVSISDSYRPTKFIIQRANPLPYDPAPKEDILIGSDEVTMTAILAGGGRESITLEGTNLQASSTGSTFKFKFRLLTTEGGFAVWPESTEIHFCDEGLGDEWELVP